jgi:sulfide:quinone oxidoreductase
MYNTSLGKIFGVDKYAAALMEVVKDRGIELNVRHNLIAVDSAKKMATFELLDGNSVPTGEQRQFQVEKVEVVLYVNQSFNLQLY